METILIDGTEKVLPEAKNFNLSEFFYTTYAGKKSFEMKKCYLMAMQVIRDFFTAKYGQSIRFKITSAIRPFDPDWSPHKIGNAVDSIPLDYQGEVMIDIRNEFKNWKKSALVKGLLKTGTNVLLIESGCMHISQRTDKLNYHPKKDHNGNENAEYKEFYADYDGIEDFYIGEWINDGSAYGKNIGYA